MSKRKYTLIAVILVILVVFVNVGTAYSSTVSELQQQKSDIESKIKAAESEIDKLSSEMTEVEKQVSQLNAQITIYQEEIDKLEVQIAEEEENLKQAEAEYEKQKELLTNRIIAQYEEGEVTYLDFLLSSESLTDFISNYYIIGEIAEMDAALLNDIENTKNEIEQTKQQLEEDKAILEEESNTLQAKKAERETYRNQLKEQKSSLEASTDELDSQLESLQAEIDEAVKAASGYVGSFSGTLSWPLSSSSYCYNLITSGYGTRTQPTAGASTNHLALDIGVSYQPVYAPADGYIVMASYSYGGYGTFIMIKHSDSLYTCYGHLSAINVSVGQTVTRGQQIGVTGNTGVSTGPHLHFEVRTSASYYSRVNPLDYISDDIYSKLVFAF